MTKLFSSLWWFGLVIGMAAQTYAESYRISVAEIATFLNLDSQTVRITMPAVVSRVQHPSLQVFGQERRNNASRLRLGCANRTCLPFYVELEFGSMDAANQFLLSGLPAPMQRPKVAPAVVHSGSTVKLEIRGHGVRLELYVRCLQSGVEGDLVRARDDVTHRIYSARVLDKNHLRSDL